VQRIAALVADHDVERVVVGRPVHLSGEAGAAAEAGAAFAAQLRDRLDVPVVEWDERLTTVVAEQGLRAGGADARARRALRDAVAAQVMLQGYLDANG
jgi:putative holliday junction resolvase